MSTFIDMVNRVLHGLREERVGSFSAGDAQQEGVKDLVNDGVRSILERVQWPFDRRSDLVLDWDGRDYPGSSSGTTASFTGATTVKIVVPTNANAFTLGKELTTGRRIYRVDLGATTTNDSGTLLSAQGYPITSADPDIVAAFLTLTLRDPLMALDGTPASSGPVSWDLFSYETILPSTVRAVLELWNEEVPLQLSFEDPSVLRRSHPRLQDVRGDPTIAYIYGYGSSTFVTTEGLISNAEVQSGTILTVFPVHDKVLRINGSYIFRHPALDDMNDTLTNVPESVIDLIVHMALILAHEGMEGNDPPRAASMRVQLFGSDRRGGGDLREGGEFGRIWREERNQAPGRRYVMASFGKHGYVPSQSRWASQTVPDPT